MAISKQWKIVGAAAAVTGLGLGGAWGLNASADDSRPELIDLRDGRTATSVPVPNSWFTGALSDFQILPGDSHDSPFNFTSVASTASANSAASVYSAQSVNSPASRQSVASPASINSPASVQSVQSVQSVDSPDSPDSPQSVQSADSWDSPD